MYLVVWYQEDEHGIIYNGDSYEEAKETLNEALEPLGSDGFKVVIYQFIEEQYK